MALQDISQVNISLETSAVSQASFGTPLFISSHRWFTERVRAYTSLTDAAADFPTDSNAYIALQQVFSQSIPPEQVKIGRREASAVTLTPEGDPSVAGTVYSVTVTDSSGSATASYTTTGGDTATTVVTALKAALSGLSDVAVSGTTTLVLTKGADDFSISDPTLLADSYTVTETAADVMSAIQAVDDEFYFVAADDHTQTFVLAMAADIEAKDKIYFLSVDEADGITALSVPAAAGDTLGKLAESEYFRTAGLYHHEADTKFPEMAYIGIGASKDPGTLTWANQRVAGLSASQDPATGLVLSATQKNNLQTRNANMLVSVGGITIFREGTVASDEKIDIIRSRDLLIARVTEAYQNKLINSDKVTYDNNGINEMRNVLTSELSRYVSTDVTPNILQAENPFTVTFPRSQDVPFATKQSRVLNASFVAYLAGAIEIVKITGTLTLDAA